MGILAYIVALQVTAWYARRDDRIPLWSAAWTLAALAFVLGRFWQRVATEPALGAFGSRTQIAASIALAVLSFGMSRAAGVPMGSRALFRAVATLGAVLGFVAALTPLVVGDDCQLRVDLLGNAYFRPRATPLRALAFAYIGAVVGYTLWRARRSALIVDPDRRRTVRRVSALLAPFVFLELVQATEIARSIQLIEFPVVAAAIFMNYEVMERYHRIHATSERLERSEASFRALIDASPDAIMIHGDGRFVFANAAAVAFLGYRRSAELLDRSFGDVVADSDRAAVNARMALAVTAIGPQTPEIERFRRADGSIITGEVVRLPLAFGGSPAVVTIARDVTEREAMEKQLRHADRMASVGTLAAGVAHEVNNPLTYVMANLDEAVGALSRSDPPTADRDARVVELLSEAHDGTERIRRVVRDITAFARQGEDKVGAVEVRSVIDSALALTRNEIRHVARLVTNSEDNLWVLTNEGRLVQVFVNLLLNAAHAVSEGPLGRREIRVTAHEDGAKVVVEVRDTGPGLGEEARQHAFDPFFTTKPVGEGTGLGLAICHGIVTRLGGSITLDNHPDGGAVARVVLPRALGSGAESKAPESPPRPPSNHRILVIDDDPIVARSLRRVLRGHSVSVATSGGDALELIEQQPFDVILCDVMMPHQSGVEFYQAVAARGRGEEERILFMTGGAFTENSRAFLAAFPERVLEKPFDQELVRQRVDERVKAIQKKAKSTASARTSSSS